MAGKKFRCWKHSTGKTGWIPSCKFTEGNAICLIRSELFLTPSVWHVNNFNGAQNEAKSAVAVNAESEWVRGPGPRVSLFSSVWILIVQRLYGGGSLTLYLIYANTLASIHPAQNPLVYVRSFLKSQVALLSGATFDPWSHTARRSFSLVNCGEPCSPRLQSDTIFCWERERESTPWDVCRKLMLQTQWFCAVFENCLPPGVAQIVFCPWMLMWFSLTQVYWAHV